MWEADSTGSSGTNLELKTQKSQHVYFCLKEMKFIVERGKSYKHSTWNQ